MNLFKPTNGRNSNSSIETFNIKKSLTKELITITIGFILIAIFFYALGNFLFSDTITSSKETKEKLINDYISYAGEVQDWVSDYNINNISKEQKKTKELQLQAIQLESRFSNFKDTNSMVYLSKMSENTSETKFLISSILTTNDKNEILIDLNKLKAILQ